MSSNEINNEFQFETKPVSSIEIQKVMRNEYQIDILTTEKYLSLIVQDSVFSLKFLKILITVS